jgi:hypothetical protein
VKSEVILITGGAGFIGSNLAHRLLSEGHQVTIFDNLSRSGCETNVAWLRETHGADAFCLMRGELTDFASLLRASAGAQRIYHLAGQVAVTTSVKDPRLDFEANALGTFNALEAARLVADDPIFLYASTNKVYGGMEDVAIVSQPSRYWYADYPYGLPETRPLPLPTTHAHPLHRHLLPAPHRRRLGTARPRDKRTAARSRPLHPCPHQPARRRPSPSGTRRGPLSRFFFMEASLQSVLAALKAANFSGK